MTLAEREFPLPDSHQISIISSFTMQWEQYDDTDEQTREKAAPIASQTAPSRP